MLGDFLIFFAVGSSKQETTQVTTELDATDSTGFEPAAAIRQVLADGRGYFVVSGTQK